MSRRKRQQRRPSRVRVRWGGGSGTGGSTGGSGRDNVAGYNTPTSGPAPCVTPSGRPCGSSALAAAPTGGGGSSSSSGSSGGMALTAHTGGGASSGSAQSGSAGSGTSSSSSGSGGWGANSNNGSSYGQGLGASPTTAGATGSGGGGEPFGSGSGSRSGGRLPSGVAATTTVASAGTNQGLPDNNCDLEEKVFTPACFDIMNDYCTTTQRQGSGCKSFCGTNRSATACAGSK